MRFHLADWNLTIAHVRGARQSGYKPEPVSLTEDGVIAFVKITKASIAADTSCVPGARKVSNQCLRKSWSLKQGGSGRGAINVPNFAKHLQIRRNHPTFQKHHEDHQSARSSTRRPSGTSERRPTVSRPVPRAEHSSPPRAFSCYTLSMQTHFDLGWCAVTVAHQTALQD